MHVCAKKWFPLSPLLQPPPTNLAFHWCAGAMGISGALMVRSHYSAHPSLWFFVSRPMTSVYKVLYGFSGARFGMGRGIGNAANP